MTLKGSNRNITVTEIFNRTNIAWKIILIDVWGSDFLALDPSTPVPEENHVGLIETDQT